MLSRRKQNRLMIWITVGMIPFAAFGITTVVRDNRVFAASVTADGEIHGGETKTTEIGQIRRESAMPCEDGEAFRRWYEEHGEEYEQETSEETPAETTGESRMVDGDAEDQADAADPESARSDPGPEEMESETSGPTFYRIAGELIDPEIQRKLYQALEAEGIAYWYTGALAQMWQESRGEQYAVNQTNGIDCGLYQYRSTYWSDGDIFDIDAQLRRYAADMAARFNAGLTVDEAISRHNTSDYITDINWTYVQQVRQHLETMEVIE